MLCVWDSVTLESKAIFKGVLRNGISNVAISSDGKKVAAVSLESESSVVFYDVDKAYKLNLICYTVQTYFGYFN